MSSDVYSTISSADIRHLVEILINQNASLKDELQLANSKLNKSSEDIRMLEDKLQNACNENAKLKVKQKEDEKLCKGLESEFSSTKAWCDLYAETSHLQAGVVHHLNGVVHHLNGVVRHGKRELDKLGIEKQKMENYFKAELSKSICVIEQKDAKIKEFETTVADLKSELEELHLESRFKEDELEDSWNAKKHLEKENSGLVSKNSDFAKQLDTAVQEIKNLNEFVNEIVVKFTDLDSQSLAFTEKIIQLNALFDSGFEMMREKGELATQHAQRKFDQLQNQYTGVTSEKDVLEVANKYLKDKVTTLKKEQEQSVMQHAEESRLAEEQIRKLESEVELLLSKKTEMDLLISKLQETIVTLSENLKPSENEMENLSLKLSEMETENKDRTEKLQSGLQEKEGEIHLLRKEIDKYSETVDSLEKHVTEVNNKLEEKDQLVQELQDREKQLEAEREKIQASLLAAERKLAEAKKQYDQMLESKQLELSRHLKELSHRNDQAISEIRRKYDLEKLEIVNREKEKAEKIVGEMEKNCELKQLECREESKKNMKRIQEEHAALVCMGKEAQL